MATNIIGRKCRVTGQVQGVFFRDSTRAMAIGLGVKGKAINKMNGSVEVFAYGGQTEVEALCQWLWHGSDMSQVDTVECEDIHLAEDIPQSFTIG